MRKKTYMRPEAAELLLLTTRRSLLQSLSGRTEDAEGNQGLGTRIGFGGTTLGGNGAPVPEARETDWDDWDEWEDD